MKKKIKAKKVEKVEQPLEVKTFESAASIQKLTGGGVKKLQDRFTDALILTGDKDEAARLVGIGVKQVFRFLQDDGLAQYLEKLRKANENGIALATAEERAMFLQGVAMSGLMPRVQLEHDGEFTVNVIYEEVSTKERLDCVDMINKMRGSYTIKAEVEHANAIINVVTGVPRIPTEEIISEEDNGLF